MKLTRSEKKNLGGIFALVYLSGALLYVFTRLIRVSSSIGSQHHPLELPVRIAHAVVAYGILVGLGYMVRAHVMPGLKAQKRVPSGLGLLIVFVVLTITALGILYSGEGTWNTVMVQTHDWAGLLVPLVIFFHAYHARGLTRSSKIAPKSLRH